MTPLPTLVAASTVTLADRFIPVLGLIAFLAIALAFSQNRKLALKNWRIIVFGFGLQFGFALIVLKTDFGRAFFRVLNDFFVAVVNSTQEGATFVFGNLAKGGGPDSLGFFFAFNVLPTIIFFSALSAILFRLGVIQLIVRAIAAVMQYTMKTSGAETLSASANIFLGQTEAPLIVRPFIPRMTNSEIMAVMVGGFATVAGGVMAAYVRFGIDAGHLLAASVMSAPAALVVAKIILPEREVSPTQGAVTLQIPKEYANVLDAAAGGASVGLKLAANVGAMLLAFISLVAMVNYGLGFAHTSLGAILGWAFSPFAWVMGVPWSEATSFGALLGTKISVNEFLAYIQLADVKAAGTMSPRSIVIATYALCGFANFSSIAIQIGGIGTIAPSRRADVARLGLKAMIGGALASWMTAAIAGVLTA